MPRLTRPFVLVNHEEFVRLMQQRKLSVRTLAAAAGVSKSKVSDLANANQPTCGYQTARRVADALGVEVGELFRPPGDPEVTAS